MARKSKTNGRDENGSGATPYIDQFALSVEQASRLTTLGRSMLYEAMADGRLRYSKCGARTLICPDDLRAFLRSEAARCSEGS